VPAEQGAYVVGLAAGLASLLMMAWLIGRLTARDEARAALLLLQLMPVAFIFRVRANHEYPMLACLLLALIALVRVADRRPLWQGVALAGVALVAGLFIKGVFVLKILLAIGVWIAVNPTGQPGARWRQAAAAAVAVLLMVAAGVAYDAAYRAATGEGFWISYWARQMGPLAEIGPVDMALATLRNVLFYVSRLLWHPAPWTAALVVAAWRARGDWTAAWSRLPGPARRGLLFALTFAALAVLMLSPAARYAERYAFSATYAVACAGVVATGRVWPAIAARLRRWDAAVPGLPAFLWLGLALLRLGAGAWLPRL
jgi:4-amino-4-deoxy-L-arabinose transferase-like glycosyltransferase